ncbi:sigma factor [Tabrizicola sp.]|uniref:sigma factor n=1 Tax=Tabrizicola sp. TaxID=2005166 RepID=UPI003F31DE92
MRPDPDSPVAGQVARAARDSYGRIVAWLARRFGNLADAEDAMSAALESALVTWPQTGVPRSPEAWLLTTARRRMLDRLRRDQTISASAEMIAHLDADRLDTTAMTLPDHRLSLLLACAHPAIDQGLRAPLCCRPCSGSTPAGSRRRS